jgi:UDP-N-acetylmuramyl pentapeptide phosphotransferase/UDP-N-acetylglucosamine-1-phosphate transferase
VSSLYCLICLVCFRKVRISFFTHFSALIRFSMLGFFPYNVQPFK